MFVFFLDVIGPNALQSNAFKKKHYNVVLFVCSFFPLGSKFCKCGCPLSFLRDPLNSCSRQATAHTVHPHPGNVAPTGLTSRRKQS